MARKEAIFKMKLDSDDAVKDVKKLTKDFKHLSDTIETDVSGSISAMEDKLYEMAAAGDTTSKEFQELSKQTAKYKKIVIETDRSIDALAEQGRRLSSALSIAEGTVAGFQAFTGISALLGDENEELLETITKLQAAQGVLNSIQIIKQQLQEKSVVLTQLQTKAQAALNVVVGQGSKAMKILRGALVGLGIGALIAGIAALIANFDKLRNMLMGVSEAQALNNKVTDTAIENTAKELSAIDRVQDALKDETLTRSEKNDVVKQLQKDYPKLLQNVDAEKESLEDLNKQLELNASLVVLQAKLKATQELRVEAYKQQLKEQIDLQRGENVGLLELAKGVIFNTSAVTEGTAASIRNIKAKEGEIDSYDDLENGIQAQIEAVKSSMPPMDEAIDKSDDHAKALENERSQLEALIKALEKRSETEGQRDFTEAIERRDEELRLIQEGYEKNLISKRQFERSKVLIEEEFESFRRQKEVEADQREQEKRQLELEKEAERKMKLEEQIQMSLDAELQREQEQVDKLLAINKAKTDKEIEQEQALADAKATIQTKATSLALDLVTLFTGKSEAEQKKAFEVTKKINVASTIMSGLQGVVNSLSAASTIPEPFGSILKAVNAASVAAATAVNVKKIKATTFSGGGGGASPSASGGGIAGASAGSFGITSDTGSDTTDLNPDGSTSGGGNNIPNKVYVTEQDITNTQNKVKTTESISTL